MQLHTRPASVEQSVTENVSTLTSLTQTKGQMTPHFYLLPSLHILWMFPYIK